MRWKSAIILAICLALTGWSPVFGDTAAKVKEASERAAQDYIKHGLLLATDGNDAFAVKSFRKAIAIMPQSAEAHSLLGSSLARLGHLKEAEEELKKAVTLKPDYAEGYYYLGLFYKDRGKEKEAEEAFRKAKQYQR